MSTNLKIVIAEPSAIVRYGLETMLKRLPGLRIQVSERSNHLRRTSGHTSRMSSSSTLPSRVTSLSLT